MFVAFVNDLYLKIVSKRRLFADDCIMYRKIERKDDYFTLQEDIDNASIWAVKNKMKIISEESNAMSFTKEIHREPLTYKIKNDIIPEKVSCK